MTTLRFICFALTILTIALVGSGCPRRTDDSNNQDKKLLEAARNGDAEIVQQLLRGGARVGLKNENGETALDLAAMQGDRDIVSLLLEAKIDTVNKNEALFWAAGNEPLVL